jgi:hypothetical protein
MHDLFIAWLLFKGSFAQSANRESDSAQVAKRISEFVEVFAIRNY